MLEILQKSATERLRHSEQALEGGAVGVRHENSSTLVGGLDSPRGRRGGAAAEPEPWPPTQWCYQDPQGAIHGPFQVQSMRAWWRQGYLSQMLPMRPGLTGHFRCLHEFFPDKGELFFLLELPLHCMRILLTR